MFNAADDCIALLERMCQVPVRCRVFLARAKRAHVRKLTLIWNAHHKDNEEDMMMFMLDPAGLDTLKHGTKGNIGASAGTNMLLHGAGIKSVLKGLPKEAEAT